MNKGIIVVIRGEIGDDMVYNCKSIKEAEAIEYYSLRASKFVRVKNELIPFEEYKKKVGNVK